jgi:hypothetical protein
MYTEWDMGGSLPAARGWAGTLRRTAGSHHVQAVPKNMGCFVTVRSIVVEVAVDVSMGGCSGDRACNDLNCQLVRSWLW